MYGQISWRCCEGRKEGLCYCDLEGFGIVRGGHGGPVLEASVYAFLWDPSLCGENETAIDGGLNVVLFRL